MTSKIRNASHKTTRTILQGVMTELTNFAEDNRGTVQRSIRLGSKVTQILHSPRMDLAQELVDHTIDFLHDDPTTLLQVSLVSRAWVSRTRTHLFESLEITHSKLSSSDTSYLTSLCGYVKTLRFTWPTDTADSSASSILDCFERSRLHTLAIQCCELYNLDERTMRRCFEKFPCASITALELHNISPTSETLFILLSLFPNTDDLTITVNEWKDRSDGPKDHEIVQRISPPRLRGSFKSFDPFSRGHWSPHRGKLLRAIAALPLQFQTMSLDVGEQSREGIEHFLNSCSKTLRKVFLILPYRKSYSRIPSKAVFSVRLHRRFPSEQLAEPFQFCKHRGTIHL